MAQPIPLEVAPRNPREELRARLESAPEDHAEAVLAAYELLQEMHQQGVLDILHAALRRSRRNSRNTGRKCEHSRGYPGDP